MSDLEVKPAPWWEIRFGEALSDRVRCVDLPVGMLAAIAEAHKVPWDIVVDQPLLRIPVALDLLANAAAHLKVKAPDPEKLTGATLQEFFHVVLPDLPEPIADPVADAEAKASGVDPTGASPSTPG